MSDILERIERMTHDHLIMEDADSGAWQPTEAAAALDPTVAQSIFDLVRSGYTLGDVAKRHGVSLDAVCGVATRDIQLGPVLSDVDCANTPRMERGVARVRACVANFLTAGGYKP